MLSDDASHTCSLLSFLFVPPGEADEITLTLINSKPTDIQTRTRTEIYFIALIIKYTFIVEFTIKYEAKDVSDKNLHIFLFLS